MIIDKSFEQICRDLNIKWKPYEKEFKEGSWAAFTEALEKRAIRTWVFKEAFLGWLLVRHFKPKTILELGSQHGHSGLIWLDAAKKTDALFIALELGHDPRNNYPERCIGGMEFLPESNEHLMKIWGDAEEKLPGLLKEYPIDFVFHDCAHTWNHVENCVSTIEKYDPRIIQTCHDCAVGKWRPNVETHYGYVHAERPIFNNHFLDNPNYYYAILGDKYGFGMAIPHFRAIQV